ncbi:MAG TPA: ABC transporter substrate-binding protein [Stellaceae bacterium]|nr:ABC transporter substrate-binding protein [Stellaceae bacterium]
MSGRRRFAASRMALGRSFFCVLSFLLPLALAPPPGEAAPARKVVLQLNHQAQFRFAGYYAALWKGFFRDAGLDVAIKPGDRQGPAPIDAVREVTEGRAQFGIATTRLLIRTSEGLPLVLLASVFQESDARVYYRADSNFSSPGALLSGTIGRLPASNFFDIELRSALKSEGLDADKLRSRSIEAGQMLDVLARRRIDAGIGSIWTVPWQAQQRGISLKSFDPAGYRTAFYGDSVFTVARYAEAHRATVRQFRQAVLKGWAYALQHSDEIAQDIAQKLPPPKGVADPSGFAYFQSKIAQRLSHYPGVPLGHANRARWRRIEKILADNGAITRPVALADFLYDPETAAGGGSQQRAALIILAVVAAAAVGIALFAWRGRGWRVRAGGFLYRGRGRLADRRLRHNIAVIIEDLRSAAERIARPLAELRRQAGGQTALAGLCDSARDGLDRLHVVTGELAACIAPEVPEPPTADLNAALTALGPRIREQLPPKISYRLSLLPDSWLCHADAEAVGAAVLDLVAAAVAAMEGGELIVGIRQFSLDAAQLAELAQGAPGDAAAIEPGDYVRVTVRDSGPGLSPERLEEIFHRRASTIPAVVAAGELANRMGGFARVESAEGVGTAVHLYFRRSEAQPVEAPAEPAKAAE